MSAVIYRGEDKQVTFTIKNSAGTAINLATSYSGIIVFFMSENGKVLGRYSREAYTDQYGNVFDTADFVQANQTTNTGEFTLNIQSDITKVAHIGRCYFDIKVQADDASFDDGTFDTVAIVEKDTDNNYFTITDAVSRNNFNYG